MVDSSNLADNHKLGEAYYARDTWFTVIIYARSSILEHGSLCMVRRRTAEVTECVSV